MVSAISCLHGAHVVGKYAHAEKKGHKGTKPLVFRIVDASCNFIILGVAGTAACFILLAAAIIAGHKVVPSRSIYWHGSGGRLETAQANPSCDCCSCDTVEACALICGSRAQTGQPGISKSEVASRLFKCWGSNSISGAQNTQFSFVWP